MSLLTEAITRAGLRAAGGAQQKLLSPVSLVPRMQPGGAQGRARRTAREAGEGEGLLEHTKDSGSNGSDPLAHCSEDTMCFCRGRRRPLCCRAGC